MKSTLDKKSAFPLESADVVFWLRTHDRAELVSVHQYAALIAVRADLAGDHFHRHADLHRLGAQVGQLGGDNGSFIQLDQCHRVGGFSSYPAGASLMVVNEYTSPLPLKVNLVLASWPQCGQTSRGGNIFASQWGQTSPTSAYL